MKLEALADADAVARAGGVGASVCANKIRRKARPRDTCVA
jgi:hypothetical protein